MTAKLACRIKAKLMQNRIPQTSPVMLESLEDRMLMSASLQITEFMASNDNTLFDEDGDSSDWIEIHNNSNDPIDLAGWHLSDDATELNKWTFPSLTLGADQYLLVFASSKDRINPASELHTNFNLNAGGEYLGLIRPDLSIASEFAPEYPEQEQDVSYGLGQTQSAAPLVDIGDPAQVFIPTDDALANTWTGASEPFDDSGWIQGNNGVGFDEREPVDTGGSTLTFGHDPINRANVDALSGSVFVLDSQPIESNGTATQWSFHSDTAGNSITPLIFTKNALNRFIVAGIGQSRVSDGSGLQTYDFDLQSGTDEVGTDYFFGWKDGTTSSLNAGVIEFEANLGDTVRNLAIFNSNLSLGTDLGGGNATTRTYSVEFEIDANAGNTDNTTTIGNVLADRPLFDSAVGSIFLLESSPFTQSGDLLQWSMFSNNTNTITPLILTLNGFGEYVITGIGQTRTSDGSGQQSFDFNLQSGSAEVGPGSYFGWKDGSNGSDNTGVIPFTDNTADSVRWFDQNTSFAENDNLGAGQAFNRTYSLQAVSTVVGDSILPMAYWNFDGDVDDLTTGFHNGVNNGATFSPDVPAELLGSQQSLTFDGIDDFVSVEINVPETEYSVSMWFKTTAPDIGIYGVMDSDLGVGGNDRHIYLTGGNIGVRTWNTEVITSTGKNYADGQWHQVVHVLGASAGGQKIYVDGELVASGTKTISDFNWQKRINIGFSNDAVLLGDHPLNWFEGQIDDVAVWNHVLTESQITQLYEGNSPLLLSGFDPFIRTDILTEMKDVNTSAYVRIPFQVDSLDNFDDLRLNVRYDDGFIAYVNGVEVARRNAPASGLETFNATATTDRDRLEIVNQELINLTPFVDDLNIGDNILSFHALNDTIDSTDFLLEAQLLTVTNSPNSFMTTPTPGGPNAPGVVAFVEDTSFSIDRGIFFEPFEVEISTLTQDATIYYTLDGSEPTPGNPSTLLYETPIQITTTTMLRAMATKDGFEPTNIDTQSYIFVEDIANQSALPPGMPSSWAGIGADYAVDPDVVNNTLPGYSLTEALMDIPTMSIVTEHDNLWSPSTGIYYNSQSREERPASFELIYPDGTTEGFQIDASLRMHGNSSRSHGFTPKHPFRVTFKDGYGPTKLDYKLFEDSDVERFDQLIFRGASTDSWPVVEGGNVLGVQRWSAADASYIRDQWIRDAQNDMGDPSGHGIYVHLYLNGLYWGLYNIAERPTNDFAASNFGGDKEEYDVIKDFAELQDGTKDTWNTLMALTNAGFETDEKFYALQGLNPDGTDNPNLESYLHLDSFINYMILHIYAGAEDWQDHNWWASRRRGPESEGFRFFAWDQEISNNSLIRTHTLFQTRFEDPRPVQSPNLIYGQLMENETFVQMFQQRVQEHLFDGGLLTPEVNHQRWMERQTEIDKAIVGESARWGDYRLPNDPRTREGEWLTEMNWMRDTYWPEIHEIALERFRRVGLYPNTDAPQFNPTGGDITPTTDIEITAPEGAIYYTLDGSDPLIQDDTPVVFQSLFDENAQKRVFIPNSPTEPIATIGTFDGADIGEGLDFEGSFLHAVNVGGPAATIRDAQFAQALPAQMPAGVNIEFVNHIPNWVAPNYGASADDNTLESIMQSIMWTPIANGGEVNAQLSNLVVGNEYKLQLMFDEGCCSRGFDVFVQGQLVADDFSPEALEAGNTTIGSFISYEFIATDEELNITLDGKNAAFADQNPIMQAITLESLPGNNLNILNWKGDLEPFDDALWIQGTGGVGYDTEPDFGPHIGVDVADFMEGINASAYVRIPFSLDAQQAAEINILNLDVQYDDGFVAYLNGVRVVSANAPAELRYNSSATTPRDEAQATNFVTFNISDYAQHLRQGENILAIHALNAGASSTDFLINASLEGGVDLEYVPSASAILYTGPINIAQSMHINARALANGEWSTRADTTFLLDDIPALRITELMYNPTPATEAEILAGFTNNDDFEYLELYNAGQTPIDLTTTSFADGIEFDFSTASTTTLNPGEYGILVSNQPAFEMRHGTTTPDGRPINVLGQYTGALNNGGEHILLADAFQRPTSEFTFEDGNDLGEEDWPTLPDGNGPSLNIIDPSANPSTWNTGTSWRTSGMNVGTPGRPDPNNGALEGDATYNGIVDLEDLAKLATNFGKNANTDPQLDVRWLHGDFTGDGIVDLADLAKLATNFGQSQLYGAGSAASESPQNLITAATQTESQTESQTASKDTLEALLINTNATLNTTTPTNNWSHIQSLLNDQDEVNLL